MEGISISTRIVSGEADLDIKLGGILFATFTLEKPETFTRADYADFIARDRKELAFSATNGVVFLSWKDDKTVQCHVSKLGESGGSIVLYLPGAPLAYALQEIIEALP